VKAILEKLKRATARIFGRPLPDDEIAPHRVLFVCMGNICRSPTAEGVFRSILEQRAPNLRVEVDSAGTHAYHLGQAPDPRACRAALRRGIDLTKQRARQVRVEDFERFDLVLAMDEVNFAQLLELAPAEYHHRIRLFLEFAPDADRRDVPDPYYGGSNGFEFVLDLVEQASTGLVEHLQKNGTGAPVKN
jgi:protein-tyrosine phosphatase